MNAPLPSLKAMAEGKIEGVSKLTIFTVDPDLVEIEEGFNLRTPGPDLDAHLESMYQAMKAGASMPPIDVIVRDGRILVRRGHCRTLCARRLKAEGTPYLMQARQYRGNEVDQTFDLIGENMGKPFSPLEQGRGFLRLVKFNITVADICRRSGLNRTTVDNGIKLAEAPIAVQKMIENGQVSVQVALDALKTHGDKAEDRLKDILVKATCAGIKKVTAKHFSGPRVTKKVALSFLTISSTIRDCMSTKFYRSLVAADDADLEGKTVEVPATLVKQLMKNQAACLPDEL